MEILQPLPLVNNLEYLADKAILFFCNHLQVSKVQIPLRRGSIINFSFPKVF